MDFSKVVKWGVAAGGAYFIYSVYRDEKSVSPPAIATGGAAKSNNGTDAVVKSETALHGATQPSPKGGEAAAASSLTKDQKHVLLDASLVGFIAGATLCFGDTTFIAETVKTWLTSFPLHYDPVFDFIKSPMSPLLAVSLYAVDVYFLVKTYVLEKMVVNRAHKKYKAHKTNKVMALHGIGSALELTVGTLAVMSLATVKTGASATLLDKFVGVLAPHSKALCVFTALLGALVNVPAGLILTPGVFGIKCLTVPGFYKFAFLRVMEAARVLFHDHRLYTNMWILLKVGTVVRLLGFWVLPYTSADRKVKGDLFTEPALYSFNILLSGYLTAAFVYPPHYSIAALGVYMTGKVVYPPKIMLRNRFQVADGDEHSNPKLETISSAQSLTALASKASTAGKAGA
jgi:hypothetical protein